MFKIITQLGTADEISLNGSTLTINGTGYDLDNPQPLKKIGEDAEGNDIYETCENQRVYLQGEGAIIFLKVDHEQQFMFINHNLMRFYDIDDNNILDLSELSKVIDHMNLSEADRIEARRPIYQDYIKARLSAEFKEIAFDNASIAGLPKLKRREFQIEMNDAKVSWKKKGVPIAE